MQSRGCIIFFSSFHAFIKTLFDGNFVEDNDDAATAGNGQVGWREYGKEIRAYFERES